MTLCAGSGQPTNIVRHRRPPHDFLCPVCGRAMGAILKLSDPEPQWFTSEHPSTAIGPAEAAARSLPSGLGEGHLGTAETPSPGF